MDPRALVLPLVTVAGLLLGIILGGGLRGHAEAPADAVPPPPAAAATPSAAAPAAADTPSPVGPPAAAPSPRAGGEPPARGVSGPPFDLADPAKIEQGKAQFRLTCAVAYCHGAEGRVGGGAPALRGRKVGEPQAIYNTIANGRLRMPPWRGAFPPEKIWTLVAYVMSLEKESPD